MAEDAELLRSYAESQSESAFSELVSRHLNLVYSAALRRTGGDSHRASDITQRVFISLASHAGSLARHPSLVGWLYTCTRNAVLMDARAEKRRQEREQEASAMQSLEPSSSAEADGTQLWPVVDEAMDELSGPDREAVLLRFFKGCSYREVGAKLLVAEDAARMRSRPRNRKIERLPRQAGPHFDRRCAGVNSRESDRSRSSGRTGAVHLWRRPRRRHHRRRRRTHRPGTFENYEHSQNQPRDRQRHLSSGSRLLDLRGTTGPGSRVISCPRQ